MLGGIGRTRYLAHSNHYEAPNAGSHDWRKRTNIVSDGILEVPDVASIQEKRRLSLTDGNQSMGGGAQNQNRCVVGLILSPALNTERPVTSATTGGPLRSPVVGCAASKQAYRTPIHLAYPAMQAYADTP